MPIPAADALVSLVATFVVATVIYTVTLHLAATFVLGDVSVMRAVLVGPVPAAIVVVVGPTISFTVAAVLAILADYAAISWSYELDRRLAAAVTLGHVVASVLLVGSGLGLAQSLGVV